MRRFFAFAVLASACAAAPPNAPAPLASAPSPSASAPVADVPSDPPPSPRRVRCGVDDRPQSIVSSRADDERVPRSRALTIAAEIAIAPPQPFGRSGQQVPTMGPRAQVTAAQPLAAANPGVAPATLDGIAKALPAFGACSSDGAAVNDGPVAMRLALASSGTVLSAELDRDPVGVDRCLLDVACHLAAPAGASATVTLPLRIEKAGPPRMKLAIEAGADWTPAARDRLLAVASVASAACVDEGAFPIGQPLSFVVSPPLPGPATFGLDVTGKRDVPASPDGCLRARIGSELAGVPLPVPTTKAKLTVTEESGVPWPAKLRIVDVLVAFHPPKGKQRSPDDALRRAEQARARIVAGEDPGAVAADLSDDPLAKETRGDLGVIRTGTVDTEFERVAFRLNVHETSLPLALVFGYHVLTRVE